MLNGNDGGLAESFDAGEHWDHFDGLPLAQYYAIGVDMRDPYRIYGGLSFYQRKEIKDLISYFRLTCNPNDEEALKRVINYPARGIGQTTVDKLLVAAGERELSIWDTLNKHLGELDVNEPTRKRLADFVMMIRSFQTMLDQQSAYAMGEYIARSTGLLQDLFIDKTPEGVSRYENIQELLNGMREFSEQQEGADTQRTLPDFLIDVALLTDADKSDDPNDNDRVSLMTIHSAKGLEFPYVYIVGMEEELFPNTFSAQSRADLEEERRLFYVALTRAEKRATLSYAMSRYKWGNLTAGEPSRFIDEIDPQYLRLPKRHEAPSFDRGPAPSAWSRPGNTSTRPAAQGTVFSREPKKAAPAPKVSHSPMQKGAAPATPSIHPEKLKKLKRVTSTGAPLEATSTLGHAAPADIAEGVTVEHERFGKGKVLKIEGNAPDVKATIFFPSSGQKQLLLRFAKLTVVEA